MDRFKADARGEAGLGGGNVAAHSGSIEEQPGARDLKGGWLLLNRHRLSASCWTRTG